MNTDVLNAAAVEAGLETAWAGRPCVYWDVVDSTNLVAKQMAAQGAPHGLLVIAGQQTAGRGRRGRAWETAQDENIMMTLLLRPNLAGEAIVQLSLVCAIAVARGIEAATGLEARIKWPNDVIVRGKKVCGMLLEMTAKDGAVDSVVAGIGINVHQRAFPQAFAQTASSLDLLGEAYFSRAAIVRAFLHAFEARYDLLAREGMDALMAEYRALSATLGSEVRVIGTDGEFTGRALDMDETGALIVALPDGERRTVMAGDVSVRGLMGYAG